MSTKTASKQNKQPANRSTLWWILGGVVGLALIVWLALSIAGSPGQDDSIAFGEVTVEGDPLPFLAEGAADPAVGLEAPTVSGSDWNDNSYTIGPDGRPKILIFLAHWCQFCQAEVPEVVDWLDAGGLGDDVDIYGVTVLSNKLRGNWPPQDWLDSEGWDVPTIMDDEDSSAVFAYGMRGTPFYVVLDGDGNNLGRFSGQVGIEGLETMKLIAEQSISG